MDTPLTATIRALEPVLQRHLSDIGIRFLGDRAEVSLRFALFLDGERVSGDPWLVPGDEGLRRKHRWPTAVRTIPLDPAMRDQILDLEESGLVGVLVSARHRSGADFRKPWPRRSWGSPATGTWRLLTHAGSAAERQAWLASLRRGPDTPAPAPPLGATRA